MSRRCSRANQRCPWTLCARLTKEAWRVWVSSNQTEADRLKLHESAQYPITGQTRASVVTVCGAARKVRSLLFAKETRLRIRWLPLCRYLTNSPCPPFDH